MLGTRAMRYSGLVGTHRALSFSGMSSELSGCRTAVITST